MKKLVFIMSALGNPNDVKRIEEAVLQGVEVEVFAFDGRREGPTDPQGVKINLIPGFSWGMAYWKRLGILRRGIKEVLKRHKKGECLYYLFRNDIALFFTMFSNRPYVFEEADMTHANLRNALLRYIMERRIKRIIKESEFSVFRSEGFVKYHFGENRPNNVFVIPNKLHPNIKNFQIKRREDFNPQKIRFGFVGSIRYNTIYSFANTVLSLFPQHEVHFYGKFLTKAQEEQFSLLKKFPNCYFHGEFRSPVDLPNIYSEIDIVLAAYDVSLINPRYAEPNKLYEAIYFNTPIIVSSNSFLADKVRSLGVGYDVNALETESVAHLVETIDFSSYEEKKRNIEEIEKKDCINNNEDFFTLLKEKLTV